VRSYALQNREFPHQTTADQWFNEAQFESYRKLGLHILETIFQGIGEPGNMSIDLLSKELADRWSPPDNTSCKQDVKDGKL